MWAGLGWNWGYTDGMNRFEPTHNNFTARRNCIFYLFDSKQLRQICSTDLNWEPPSRIPEQVSRVAVCKTVRRNAVWAAPDMNLSDNFASRDRLNSWLSFNQAVSWSTSQTSWKAKANYLAWNEFEKSRLTLKYYVDNPTIITSEMTAYLNYHEWDKLHMAQKLFDLGVHRYGVHFHYQLDCQLTWLNLKPKSGRQMNFNASVGSTEILLCI